MGPKPLTESLRETLSLFDEAGAPWTTPEVATRLDLGRRSTYERLERLVDQGRLETKKVGANARVWWRPRDDVDHATPDWQGAAESLVDDVLGGAEVGVFILDEDFDVAWINEATERYFGLDRNAALGRDKRGLVDETIADTVENSTHFAETVLATYDDNTYTEQFECHVTPATDRAERWLEHRSKPIESGAYAGGRVELYYDVTDQKRVESAHQADREQFASLVDAVEEYAIFLLDPDGHVQTWNPGAERIKGYEADDIVGEHFSALYTEEDRSAGVPADNLTTVAREGSAETEGWRVRADGSRFWANVSMTAITDDEGELEGYAKVTRDMTERREHERQLRRERDLNDRLLETAPVRLAVFAADGTLERMNSQGRRELGGGEANGDSFDVESVSLFDEAGTPLSRATHPVHRVVETGDPVSDVLVQHETSGGERRWASLTASPLFDDDGDLERVLVAGKNVTELKEKERQLERRRDELERELDEVFDRISDGFYGLDDELRFTYVNDRAEEVLGLDVPGLIGRRLQSELELTDKFERALQTALDEQEQVSVEHFYPPLGAWFENTIYPSEEGLSVYFTEITERKRAEAAMRESEERLRLALDAADMGVWELDLQTNASPVGLLNYNLIFGYDEPLDDWGFERFLEHVHPADRERVERSFEAASETGEWTFECRIVRTDDAVRWIAAHGEFSYDDADEPVRAVGTVQDITERKERERALEESRQQYQTLVENVPNGVVALLDDELRYTLVEGQGFENLDFDANDLLGERIQDVYPDHILETMEPNYRAALDGEPNSFELALQGRMFEIQTIPLTTDDGGVFAIMAMSQDITERKQRERALREAKTQLEAATEASSVGTWQWHVPEDRFIAGPSLAHTFGIDPEAVREGVSLDRLVSAIHEDDRDRVERAIEAALSSCGEYEAEYRVRNGADEIQWVMARGRVECDEDGDPVTFPGALTDITKRKRAEQALDRHREQLEALNSLNEVVQGITDAVVEQSTREEIETAVVTGLADADSFSYAWIGDVDTTTQTIRPRTEAGAEGYLDEITISVDPDDERSRGPTSQAVITGETQVAQNIPAEDAHDPWRDHVEAYGFQSSAAIPIVHEGTVYGVLNVYADRPFAFADAERQVLTRLGELVGHAISAVERKRALMSDEVVELEFRISDLSALLGLDEEIRGRSTLDQAIPTSDGAYLVYGTATEEARPLVDALVDELPHWKSVEDVGEHGDVHRFEARLNEPPVLSEVASRGGYVQQVVIEDGDLCMTIHLPPTVDVRSVTDVVTDAYPTADLLAHRQFSRTGESANRFERLVHEDLTDRQQAALEAAFMAGFFEWPRESDGNDVAESLGISSPTFHQHLRKAEKKVFDTLLSTATAAPADRRDD